MKIITKIRKCNLLVFSSFTLIAMVQNVSAQKDISLNEAVALAKQNNKSVAISRIEEVSTLSDYRDAKNSIFPNINAGGSYQRFTKLTLYDHGLNDAISVDKRPSQNGANLGMDVSFNVFSGGKTRSIIEESGYRTELSAVNTEETKGNVGLQTALQYLDLVRLYHLKNIIEEQQKRAESRLKNITSFYKNQKVTKSDLLRAELTLSNVLLNKTQAENDITIAKRQMGVLLNISDFKDFYPSDSVLVTNLKEIDLNNIQNDAEKSYLFQKTDVNSKIQTARIKNIKSNFYPTASLISSYGFNYPNTIFYPPVDQIDAIGFVGMKISYNISSLYQNANKMKAAKQRLNEIELQKSYIKDNVNQNISALKIKYDEALNRIEVASQSIEQAKVNLKIIDTKYQNQLSLLTDLLDADNLYQETKYTFLNAQINALIIYYKLQFTTGNL